MVHYLLVFLAICLIFGIASGLLISLLFLVIAIHELSHAVAAAWLGLGIRCIRIAYLTLIPTETGWIWRWVWSRGDLDGIVMVDRGMASGRPYALMLLAGPVGNLATAILMGVLGLLPLPWIARSLLLLFAGLNLLYGVVNLIPHRYKQLNSDGGQLLQMFLRRRR